MTWRRSGEWSPRLRPGGLLVAHVPERDWKPVLRGSERTWRNEVRHGYDAEELAQRLHELGLEDVRIRETSRSLVRAAQEVRDRISSKRPRLRAAVFLDARVTVRLERTGLTWGPGAFSRSCARLRDELGRGRRRKPLRGGPREPAALAAEDDRAQTHRPHENLAHPLGDCADRGASSGSGGAIAAARDTWCSIPASSRHRRRARTQTAGQKTMRRPDCFSR